jgi:diacylglycerol kinase
MSFRVVRPDMILEPMAAPSPRTWRAKFGEACKGIKLGVRGQSSFFAHFFAATLVVVAAVILQCDLTEWCLLLGCIGFVMTAELVNSAIETLFRGLDVAARDKHVAALHIAAGAVLTASGTAAVIGLLVLGRRLWSYIAPAM